MGIECVKYHTDVRMSVCVAVVPSVSPVKAVHVRM